MTPGAKIAAGRSRKAAARKRVLPLDERQEKYLKGVGAKWRQAVEKLFRQGGPPMQAIRLKCYDCMGYEEPIARVRECDSTTCPLWRFRPGVAGAVGEGVVGED